VAKLEDVLENNNIFPEPRNGLIFIVDEAQKIIGQDFADDFFNILVKRGRSSDGTLPFHKVCSLCSAFVN
jgi:hypothetical protein